MPVSLKAVFLFCLAAAALLPCTGSCRGSLTDGEKLATVYGMYDNYKTDFPGVKDISPGDAMALLAGGKALFIDTRNTEEMEVSMLPGAITGKEYTAGGDTYAGRVPIAYCTISYRSGVFSSERTKKGATVYNLRGGLLAWVLEGGKVYDKKGNETKRIHVYGRRWDYPPRGYSSVY